MTVSSIRTRPRPTTRPAPVELEDPAALWRAWRATRAAELRRPHGWLSLSGFAWLTPVESQVPGLPGRWSADEDSIMLAAATVDGLAPVDDRPGRSSVLNGRTSFPVPDGASVTAVRHGERHIELLRRAGRPAVRIRDPHAISRTAFRNVPTYDWGERWVVAARFVPAPEPQAEVVLTARPDLLTTAVTHGRVDFLLHGRPLSLVATVGSDGGLTVAFRDPTNEATTAPWRVLTTAAPDGQRHVVLDFNRAVNPPFAFTPYGTCPAPVAANRLPVAVTAGEQAPVAVGDAR